MDNLNTVKQLLILGRKVNKLGDQLENAGIIANSLFDIETDIENIIFSELDLCVESVSPIAQTIARCVRREVSIKACLECIRVRDPGS